MGIRFPSWPLACLALSLALGVEVSFAAEVDRVPPGSENQSEKTENEQIRKAWEDWNAPCKPFRILGNVYYVGTVGIGCYLITTPQGHILLDTGFEKTVPRIQENVAALGFKLTDIRILLNTHAHLDHCGGHSKMQKLSGASIWMSEADAALLASGGLADFTPFSNEMKAYAPAKADRILRDGGEVILGGTAVTCHLTQGHTKGCTTWTMDVRDEGVTRHIVFFGSTSLLPGVHLINNAKYPAIADDLRATYAKLKALPCDVFLAPHTSFFGLAAKAERLARGETPNPFIDPAGYQAFVIQAEHGFLEQLENERKTTSPGG